MLELQYADLLQQHITLHWFGSDTEHTSLFSLPMLCLTSSVSMSRFELTWKWSDKGYNENLINTSDIGYKCFLTCVFNKYPWWSNSHISFSLQRIYLLHKSLSRCALHWSEICVHCPQFHPRLWQRHKLHDFKQVHNDCWIIMFKLILRLPGT